MFVRYVSKKKGNPMGYPLFYHFYVIYSLCLFTFGFVNIKFCNIRTTVCRDSDNLIFQIPRSNRRDERNVLCTITGYC